MTASGSGYRPRAIMTSRKLAAMADKATRTVPGRQRRVGVGYALQPQIFEGALTAHAQPPCPVTGRHQKTAHRAAAVDPRGVDRPAAQHHLRLT